MAFKTVKKITNPEADVSGEAFAIPFMITADGCISWLSFPSLL